MLINYLVVALRNLRKSKVHAFINIAGLALGVACVLFIALYLERELSYDRFHENAEDLYRIIWEDANPQTRTPHPMAQALKSDFPEVESAVSLTPLFAAGLTRETHSFRNPDSDVRYDEKNVLAVDTTFFDVFSFPLIQGDRKTALKHVNGILLSESLAAKYFPGEDPVGKNLAVDEEDHLLEVVGVFKDVPDNSHFNFDMLISYVREKSFDPQNSFFSWADFGHYNYIRLREGADPAALEAKIMPWARKYINITDEQYEAIVDQGYGLRLQPVTDIHLRSHLRWELATNGHVEYVYILTAAALLTLIIACVNFINLTTANSAERAKEIGVRKSLGAGHRQLSAQFLSESVIMSLIAIAFAVMIVELALPAVNLLADTSLHVDYNRYGLWLVAFGVGLGLLSGWYPAAYLSSIKPQLVLKGKMIHAPGGAGLRKGLIVFQFFMSMILIASAIVVFHQLTFLTNKNLGFRQEEVLVIPVKNEDGMRRFEAFQSKMYNIEGIVSVSASSNIPGGQFNQHLIASLEFPDDGIAASEVFVDNDFFSTLGIHVADGRTFLRGNEADANAFVLNETAAAQLNVDRVVGKEIWWIQAEANRATRGRVIGVVSDFHFQSLHDPIRPLIFLSTKAQFNHILVRVDMSDFHTTVSAIEKVYKEFEPVYGFEFSFLEDQLNAQYAAEKGTATALTLFSTIAIVIACLGLFGMALLTFQQKIKELTIRKVLGATLYDMLTLLVSGFTRLILLAVLLATPVAWLIMHRWLENFSYRINIHPAVFLVSGVVLVAVAWITLSYFTVRAGRLNPADTLKNE